MTYDDVGVVIVKERSLATILTELDQVVTKLHNCLTELKDVSEKNSQCVKITLTEPYLSLDEVVKNIIKNKPRGKTGFFQ